VLLEENILAFASGNLIHIFNVDTKELWFRRSAGGGGIGHMAVRTFLHCTVFQFNKVIQHY
jgi:acyl CoA:acetate/3-ketoacid CoA transferase alpha subunit